MIRRWVGVGMGLSASVSSFTDRHRVPGRVLDPGHPGAPGVRLSQRHRGLSGLAAPFNPDRGIFAGFGLAFTVGVIGEDIALTGGPLAGWGPGSGPGNGPFLWLSS